MPNITWDQVGDRRFESGLDRGVLYLPDGSAVPWNGLTGLVEQFNHEVTPVYFDGVKVNDLVTLGQFSATLSAITYPDEFIPLEGLVPVKRGVFYADQMPQTFGLCYRSRLGDDVNDEEASYKIHILYNVTAIPSDKTYASASADPSLMEFSWDLTAIAEEIPGFRPTAHIVIDTAKLDPWLLEEIEEILYGSGSHDASLIPLPELAEYLNNWFRIRITDNGDGTWTAETTRDGLIFFGMDAFFQIVQANAVFLNDYTFIISDTEDISQVPQIKIVANGDGTWTASSDYDALIQVVGDEFTILNANVDYLDEDTYELSDTPMEN